MPFRAGAFDRDAQHGQGGPGGAHARQVRRPAGGGDDDAQPAGSWRRCGRSRPGGPGVRWADTMRPRAGTPSRSSRCRPPAAASAQSDWLPMMMPTRTTRRDAVPRHDRQAMLSGISRLSSQATSSLSISLRFLSRCTMQQVDRCRLSGEPGDHGVQVAVFAAQFMQLGAASASRSVSMVGPRSMGRAAGDPSTRRDDFDAGFERVQALPFGCTDDRSCSTSPRSRRIVSLQSGIENLRRLAIGSRWAPRSPPVDGRPQT